MKKKLSYIILQLAFLSMPITLRSQMISQRIDTPVWKKNTIVREWNSAYAISYYEGNGKNWLTLIDYAGNITPYNLDNRYYVNDIRILNDVAYLAGFYVAGAYEHDKDMPITGAETCVIMRIDLTLLTSGASSLNADYYKYNQGIYNKLAVFDNSGRVHIVAIGEDAAYSIVFEGDYFTSNTIVGKSINLPISERLKEVIISDSYVALVGYSSGVSGVPYGYTIRRGDKHNLLNDSFTHDVFCYSEGDTYYAYVTATVLKEDNIAVASAPLFLTASGGQDGETRLSTIDLNTMQITNEQRIWWEDKELPIEMVYYPNSDTLVLLQLSCYPVYYNHSGPTIFNNYSFITFLPSMTSNYSMEEVYVPDTVFTSIDKLYGRYFFAGGGRSWFFKDGTVQPSQDTSPWLCYEYYKKDVEIITPVDFVKGNIPYAVPMSSPTPPQHFPLTLDILSVYNYCR